MKNSAENKNMQTDPVIQELEANLKKTANLKDRADLIVNFWLKSRGIYPDYRTSLNTLSFSLFYS